MPLLRTFAKVDKEGKIHLPANVRRLGGFAPGDQVEIRLQGPHQRPWIVIHRRTNRAGKVGVTLPAIPIAHY